MLHYPQLRHWRSEQPRPEHSSSQLTGLLAHLAPSSSGGEGKKYAIAESKATIGRPKPVTLRFAVATAQRLGERVDGASFTTPLHPGW